jgi:hypothetical protein
MASPRAAFLLLCLFMALWSTGASAQSERERARELGYAGVRAYGAGDYAGASKELEQAFSLLPVPSLGLWSARALVKLGRLAEAEARYQTVAGLEVNEADPRAQKDAKVTAELELRELSPRIPSLRIIITGAEPAEVVITVDGVQMPFDELREPRRVNPGRHTITGVRRGDRSDVVITIEEGQHQEVFLRFAELAKPLVVPPSTESGPRPMAPAAAGDGELSRPWRTAAFVGMAAGGVLLATSAVTYWLGRSEHERLQDRDQCEGDSCNASADLDSYETLRSIQLVSLIAGSVLGVAWVTTFFLSPDDSSAPSAQINLDVSSARVSLSAHF